MSLDSPLDSCTYGNKSSDSKHSKTSVLELLKLNLPAALLIGGVHPHPVDSRLSTSSGRLALELSTVLVRLNDTAEDDELSPPLKISLSDGSDRIINRYISLEMSEILGEDVSNGGEHSRASIGELGGASAVSGDPVAEVEGVELKVDDMKRM